MRLCFLTEPLLWGMILLCSTAGGVHAAVAQDLHAEQPVAESKAVEHAAKVKPVETFLRGGVTLKDADKAKLEDLESVNFWFRIPDWLAGKWQYYSAENTSYTDLKTHKTSRNLEHSETASTEIFGWQRDKNGDVWHYADSPHAQRSVTDAVNTYYIRHEDKPVSSSPTKLVCKLTYTYSSINPKTNIISKTYQSEDFATYTQGATGEMRRDVSARCSTRMVNRLPKALPLAWRKESCRSCRSTRKMAKTCAFCSATS